MISLKYKYELYKIPSKSENICFLIYSCNLFPESHIVSDMSSYKNKRRIEQSLVSSNASDESKN